MASICKKPLELLDVFGYIFHTFKRPDEEGLRCLLQGLQRQALDS